MSKYPYIGKSPQGNSYLVINNELIYSFLSKSWMFETEGFADLENITADYLRNTKIRIESPEHSRMVQELVFGAGGCWMSHERDVIDDAGCKYFFIDRQLNICATSSKITFDIQDSKEIHLPMPTELQLPEVGSGAPMPEVKEAKYMNKCITPQMSDSAISTLENLGYTYHGGELWKPPLGECPEHICGEWPQVGDKVEFYKTEGNYTVEPRKSEFIDKTGIVRAKFPDGTDSGLSICAVEFESPQRDIICMAEKYLRKPQTQQEKLAAEIERLSWGGLSADGQAANNIAKAILGGKIPGLKYEGGDA